MSSGRSVGEVLRRDGRRAIDAVALVDEAHRREGVEEDRRAARVRLQASSDFVRRRTVADGGEDVELDGGEKHAALHERARGGLDLFEVHAGSFPSGT